METDNEKIAMDFGQRGWLPEDPSQRDWVITGMILVSLVIGWWLWLGK